MKKAHLVAIFSIICGWWLFAILINNSVILPDPKSVFFIMLQQLVSLDFHLSMLASLGRLFFSFLFSLIVALMLSYLTIKSILWKDFIGIYMNILRVIPTAALVLVLLIWLKRDGTVFIITTLVMLPLIYELLINSYHRLSLKYRDPLTLYGDSKWRNFIAIYLPLSIPMLLGILKSSFILGLKVVVTSEVLVSIQSGIGRQLQIARINLETGHIFAITLWMIIAALVVSALFDYLIHKKTI